MIIYYNDGMIINQGNIAHILIVTTVSYPYLATLEQIRKAITGLV